MDEGGKMKGGGESSSENHSRRQEQSSGVHPRLPSSQEDRAGLTKSKLKKKFKACLLIQLQ